jgi:hypothetical protein
MAMTSVITKTNTQSIYFADSTLHHGPQTTQLTDYYGATTDYYDEGLVGFVRKGGGGNYHITAFVISFLPLDR